MNIYLMQHGKPVPKEKNPDKPLSDRGRDDVEKMAGFLKKAGIQVETVFHSGKTRARQTAEIISSKINPGKESQKREGRSPLDDVKAIAEEIKQGQKDFMIVGHLPYLEKLVSFLTTGSDSSRIVSFQQGGVVCLRTNEEEKNWAIAWMLVPEILP
ncbi:MAG: phosphohistidine phosphatase SixA [Pseudomonadota bacterium]